MAHYCGIKADKRYQLADWRLRPLTPEMIGYARGDTHHLLYVYDRLKQQLAAASVGNGGEANEETTVSAKDLIGEVLRRSRDVCLTLARFPTTCALAYHADYRKNGGGCDLDMRQLAVYAALFAWRDRRSREDDESVGYVMPRALLLRIARGTPTTVGASYGCGCECRFTCGCGGRGEPLAPTLSSTLSSSEILWFDDHVEIRHCDWLYKTRSLEMQTGHVQKSEFFNQSQRCNSLYR